MPGNFANYVDIQQFVTSYFVSDGINAYSSADPNSLLWVLYVTTNASGAITYARLQAQLWLTGSSPHRYGDRWSYISIDDDRIDTISNGYCNEVNSNSAPPGLCISGTIDRSSSTVRLDRSVGRPALGVWTIIETPVPTLSNLMLFALCVLVGGSMLVLRRRCV